MKFEPGKPNVANGLTLLRSIKEGAAPCVFFDPQYRDLLEEMDYGNEGEGRQAPRVALPQMTAEVINRWLFEIARVLRPGRYCFMWLDKYAVSEGLYHAQGLKRVDLITWDKMRIGNGKRSRRRGEYLRVLQKPPIEATQSWRDRGIPDVWPEKKARGLHPHVKPLELQRRLIEATTERGEFVVDPCAGSYSVMDAAHACGRQFMGCDLLEPKR